MNALYGIIVVEQGHLSVCAYISCKLLKLINDGFRFVIVTVSVLNEVKRRRTRNEPIDTKIKSTCYKTDLSFIIRLYIR